MLSGWAIAVCVGGCGWGMLTARWTGLRAGFSLALRAAQACMAVDLVGTRNGEHRVLNCTHM